MADGPDAASGHERSRHMRAEAGTLDGQQPNGDERVYTRGTPERYNPPNPRRARGQSPGCCGSGCIRSARREVRIIIHFQRSARRSAIFSILQSVLYTPRATSGRAVCTRSGRCGCTPGTCPRDLSSYVVGTFTTSQPGTVLSRVSSALASAPTALASAMASSSKPSSSIMSLRSLASACPSSSCR